MRKSLSLVFIGLSFFAQSQSTINSRPVAAPFITTGSYSSSYPDPFSFTGNPASLASTGHIVAGIYTEKRFLLAELALYNAVMAIPTRLGNFGLQAGYFGFAAHRETELGFAYARKLGNQLAAGVLFNYVAIKTAGYGSASALGAAAGLILHLNEKICTGIQVSNPAGGRFAGIAGEKLPFVYTVGLGYEAPYNFYAALVIEKEENRPVNGIAVLQYQFHPRLLVRLGISSSTAAFSLGIRVGIGSLQIAVSAACHPRLGITPGLELLFPATGPSGETP